MTTIPRHQDMLAICVAACMLGGCISMFKPDTRQAQWARARQSLTMIQQTLVAMHAAGKLSPQQVLEIDVMVKVARGHLAKAELLLDDPNWGPYQESMDFLNLTLKHLEAYRAVAPPTAPATQPPQPSNVDRRLLAA